MELSATELNLQELYDELFPICRSITGPGYEKSLQILQRYIPLNIESFDTGTRVFDWTVPSEWKFMSATLKDPDGNVIIDAEKNSLHILNFSEPFTGQVSLEELKEHIVYDENLPDAIPYRTAYYTSRWGFCMSYNQFKQLKDGMYEVDIQTKKRKRGSLKVGVCELKGESSRVVLISAPLCHPSMLNNELSGPLALVCLYHLIKAMPQRRFTYRFVLNPETIGSISYLSDHHQDLKKRLEYGMVLTCLAAPRTKGAPKDEIKTISIEEPNSLWMEDDEQLAFHEKLLKDFKDSFNHNFLKLPISFKLSRQSYMDALEFDFSKEQDNHIKGYREGGYFEKSLSLDTSCYKELTDTTLNDSTRIEMYKTHLAYFDRAVNPNHLLGYHIYSDPAKSAFKCKYTIDNRLRNIAFAEPERYSLRTFCPTTGSDERQYCSPVLNLPCVQACRTQYAIYDSYHSSLDNQDQFSLCSIIDSAIKLYEVIRYYEIADLKPSVLLPGEPQLGYHGLYPNTNDPANLVKKGLASDQLILTMYLISLSSGTYTTKQIMTFLKTSPLRISRLIYKLRDKGIIELVR